MTLSMSTAELLRTMLPLRCSRMNLAFVISSKIFLPYQLLVHRLPLSTQRRALLGGGLGHPSPGVGDGIL